MNWITTMGLMIFASLIVTIFFTKKEDNYYRGYGRENRRPSYEYIWSSSFVLNLVIGVIVGCLMPLSGFVVPILIAMAIGEFFIVFILNAMLFNTNVKAAVASFVILLVLACPATWIMIMQGVGNANEFDTMITTTKDDLFHNEIPDNMVRLVTEEYANFIVRKTALAEFGSNREIAATSIVCKDGRLVWVCVIVSTNTFAENYLQGMVVVDANNATVTEIIHADDLNFDVGEGLFWANNIQMSNYWNDANYIYTDAYPMWDDEGNLVYVQTRTHVDSALIQHPAGPIVYYQDKRPIYYNTIEDAPDWLPRAYSEDWLETMVDWWGGYRRGSTFDLLAGGFIWIPPSNDRLEMSEDVRYILNPDTMKVEALVMAHPVVAELSLKGMFRGTTDAVMFYDYSDRNFIAGQAAIDNIVGSLTKPSQGHYEGAMPLLYPVYINNETKWTWYCPIYFYRTESDSSTKITNMELHALAMIDATDARTFFIQETTGGYYGETLVQMTKQGYAALFGAMVEPESNETTIISDVQEKWTYDVEGTTNIVLQTNSTIEYIVGTANDMNLTDWLDLLSITTGQIFQATVVLMQDGQYHIIAFNKL
jgi:hypothetical protein